LSNPFEIDWQKQGGLTTDEIKRVITAPLEVLDATLTDADLHELMKGDPMFCGAPALTPPPKREPRRARLFTVPARDVMDLISLINKGGGTFLIAKELLLPEGAEIVSVHSDSRFDRSITLVVEHESFEPVAEACEIPRQEMSFENRVVNVEVKEL
jgi:hypothetical protein